CLVIESDRIHDERVAFPPCDRIAHPKRLQIFRMTAAVQKQLPITVHVAFIEDHDEFRRLNEFLWERGNTRNSCRKAASLGVIFAQTSATLLVHSVGPGLKRNLTQRRETKTRIPNSGEIDFTFRRARRRTNRGLLIPEISLAWRRDLSEDKPGTNEKRNGGE